MDAFLFVALIFSFRFYSVFMFFCCSCGYEGPTKCMENDGCCNGYARRYALSS